jgi:hypothetical protein
MIMRDPGVEGVKKDVEEKIGAVEGGLKTQKQESEQEREDWRTRLTKVTEFIKNLKDNEFGGIREEISAIKEAVREAGVEIKEISSNSGNGAGNPDKDGGNNYNNENNAKNDLSEGDLGKKEGDALNSSALNTSGILSARNRISEQMVDEKIAAGNDRLLAENIAPLVEKIATAATTQHAELMRATQGQFGIMRETLTDKQSNY